ncbi:MAG: CopG family transcriptional regulator [Clostridia bacterium]|nr:CopG family transcriptional regulator [Clostridia bacterium]
MKRVGVIGIIVCGDKSISIEMQKLLNEFGDIIIGRMGLPRQEVSAISLVVEGTVERISALSGRLGKFPELNVKSALTSFEIE